MSCAPSQETGGSASGVSTSVGCRNTISPQMRAFGSNVSVFTEAGGGRASRRSTSQFFGVIRPVRGDVSRGG
jgi:hypothetical protein